MRRGESAVEIWRGAIPAARRLGVVVIGLACGVLAACGGGGDAGAMPPGVAPLPQPTPVTEPTPLPVPLPSPQPSPAPAPGTGATPGVPASIVPRIEPYERTAPAGPSAGSLASAFSGQAAILPRTLAQPPQTSWTPTLAQPARVPIVELGALPADLKALEAHVLAEGSVATKAVTIGASRPVLALHQPALMHGVLAWTPTASGGLVAAVRVRAEGAAGLRVGLQVQALPGEAIVSVSGQDATERVPADRILETVWRNVQASGTGLSPVGVSSHGGKTATASPAKSAGSAPARGESASADPRLYWLPAVAGPQALLHIELPVGVDPSAVQVAVPRLAHLWWTHAAAREGVIAKIGEAGRCNVDVTCAPDHEAQARSVARLEFMRDGLAYLCTGTLMADTAASGIPYFLTAQHCVNDQASASSVSTYWFYRSTACNSGVLDARATQVHGGATLLHASAADDTSFLRLAQSPPVRAVYAGSLLVPADRGSVLSGLHHPGGDLLKLSSGTLEAYASCAQTRCESVANAAQGQFMALRWRSGTTESGSSGSPVFATLGGQRYVAGHLFAGLASCQQPEGFDYYGRFDRAYPALRPWLGAVAGAPG